MYKLSKTKFSRFKGTRGDKNQIFRSLEIIDKKNELTLPSDHYKEPITELYDNQMVPLVRTYHEKENFIALHILLPEDADQTHFMQAMAVVRYCLKSDWNEIFQYFWPLLLILGPKIILWILSCRQNRQGMENLKPFAEMQKLLTRKEPTAPLY